jgi:hypothetical protein
LSAANEILTAKPAELEVGGSCNVASCQLG